MSKFLPFDEALAVARSLGLANRSEWYAWCKEGLRPPNVPANPSTTATYRGGGWQGWVHWLGSGNLKKASKFAPFGQALAFARSLSLASSAEWTAWCKEGTRPPDVPADPSKTYKDGEWQGWGHWLGTGRQSSKTKKEGFLPFGEALAVARSLNLATQKVWGEWCKEGTCPPNVPSHPHRTYTDGGWQGWGHWLGTGNQCTHAKRFLPFGEALSVAQSLGLASAKEWQQWCKEGMCPPNVPSAPNRTYKGGGWQGWGHWLGTGNQSNKTKKEQFLPFDEALRAARQLRLGSKAEWKLWCRSGARPANLPANPHRAYVHGGWAGWEHWLCRADRDAALAPAQERATSKRTAPGRAGTPGNGRGKRQRR